MILYKFTYIYIVLLQICRKQGEKSMKIYDFLGFRPFPGSYKELDLLNRFLTSDLIENLHGYAISADPWKTYRISTRQAIAGQAAVSSAPAERYISGCFRTCVCISSY